MSGGPHPDELISAAVSGELTPEERVQLDAHLEGCAQCRDTYAAFLEQRRILGGMRREPAPATLGPRVFAAASQPGVPGRAPASAAGPGLPWWRRPTSLAMLGAAALLVLVVSAALGIALGQRDDDLTGAQPSATAPLPTGTPESSPDVASPPTATATLTATPTPSSDATPAPTPDVTVPPPETPLVSGDVVYLTLEGELGEQHLLVVRPALVNDLPLNFEADTEVIADGGVVNGPPIHAELAPDGEWVAYQTRVGESGTNAVWALNLADGDLIELGQSIAGLVFNEHMAWSSDGHRLAYTLTDPADGSTDVWLFDGDTRDAFQFMSTGDSYAGSWQGTDQLWVSTASEPASHRLTLAGAGPVAEPLDDPAGLASLTLDGVFQPMLSPDGSQAIYWRGALEQPEGSAWQFVTGGTLYLAAGDNEGPRWEAETALLPTLPEGRDGLTSAEVAWSFNNDDFAVWNIAWSGVPQPSENAPSGAFPDPTLVYFGKVSEGQLITDFPSIDPTGGGDGFPVDVEFSLEDVADTGVDVAWVTLQLPIGGTLDPPRAVLMATAAGPTGGEFPASDPARWTGPAMYLP